MNRMVYKPGKFNERWVIAARMYMHPGRDSTSFVKPSIFPRVY